MEEKKTTRTKKSDGGGWKNFLMESIFRNIQGVFDGAFASVHAAVQTFTRRLAQRALFFFLTLVGLTFLLLGLARLLSTLYGMPGLGELIVGVCILLIALVLYIFNRNDN